MANEQTTNELREGQMHLAQEVDAKNEQIRKLREQVARLSAPVSDEEMNQFAIHSIDLAMPYRREPALLRSSADALIAARLEGK